MSSTWNKAIKHFGIDFSSSPPLAAASPSLVAILTLVGFGLRFGHLLGRVYHIDEFISMLAAIMVAQKGLPVLPSGLFYDLGLTVSYLSGALVGLLGFNELIIRWPSCLASTLTIPLCYGIGRRLFSSRLAGLAAATLVAFDSNAVLWGGRMRMYAVAQLGIFLLLYWLIEGTLRRPRPSSRYLFIAFCVMTLLSHTASGVLLPPLLISLVLVTWLSGSTWYRHSLRWREIAVAGLALAPVFGILAVGQMGTIGAVQFSGGQVNTPLGLKLLGSFIELGLSWSRFDDFIYVFMKPPYNLLMPLVVVGALITIYRVMRRSGDRRDWITLLLILLFVLTLFEMGAILSHTWRKTRYLFILCIPTYILLAADGTDRLGTLLASGLAHLRNRSAVIKARGNATVVAVVLLIIAGTWGGDALGLATLKSTGNYDTAFAYVKKNWRSGDRVMSVHPSASYIYLNRSDYYASQRQFRVLSSDDSEEEEDLVDRYVGSPLIASVEDLNRALSTEKRVWFVCDEDRLTSRFEPLFAQEVFAQMDMVYQAGPVFVFLSRPYPRPVPADPPVALSANFGDVLTLGGYGADFKSIAPDGTVQLDLYWQPGTARLAKPYKIFVHLRNDQNQTVAQADHYLMEGIFSSSTLRSLGEQGGWLRDTAELALPGKLPSGTYRLLVGLYDPATFERVPLMGDESGENAAILETVTVP
jgi:4-amino-4-deoxy-L-arabinose transferase-like glycosyltransferase